MADEGPNLDVFLAVLPGLEPALLAEARALGLRQAAAVPGGVTCRGTWADVWRANLWLRGASRVLVRLGAFRALHLAQLDKRARKFPWGDFLRADVPLCIEASCRKSRIYHAGAAAQRVQNAIGATLGAPISPEAPLSLRLRIEDDLCTLSIDTSGALLHLRGHKTAVGKAPLRETMAALFLRQCGYEGTEPVLDPMCGSGSFVIEAAEIAAGLAPGRGRSFAFAHLPSFDAAAWEQMRAAVPKALSEVRFYGRDRDAGAIRMSTENAARAGVGARIDLAQQPLSALERPEGPPGLVMVNPPYGARIGNKKQLYGLYGSLGAVLRQRFAGWRVGLVTSEGALARATGLPFGPDGPPVAHGGLRVRLYRTEALV